MFPVLTINIIWVNSGCCEVFPPPFVSVRTSVRLRSPPLAPSFSSIHLRSPPLTSVRLRLHLRSSSLAPSFSSVRLRSPPFAPRPPPTTSSSDHRLQLPLQFTPKPILGIWCLKSICNFQIILKFKKKTNPKFYLAFTEATNFLIKKKIETSYKTVISKK